MLARYLCLSIDKLTLPSVPAAEKVTAVETALVSVPSICILGICTVSPAPFTNAEKWTKYEETKRASLLESHPEDERESLSKLDLETLKYVTDKINNTKANAPEVAGHSRKDYKAPPKDWTKLSQSELRENWDDIVKDAVERSKANVKTQ